MADVLFKKVDYTLKKLLEDIDMGDIALPDIQRPFVWSTSKVRDLFDSMYRGYPIGYLLFWESGHSGQPHAIGTDPKQKAPHLLIVDGQQRLTALYAVTKGKPIVAKTGQPMRLRIAFNPLEEKFEVTNSAIEKDPTWIPDISEIWNPSTSTFAFISSYFDRVKKRRTLAPEDEQRIATRIDRLQKLMDYPLTALEISSSVDEDTVAEIFVRINSKGIALNQADFILTLMAVFWDEGRKELEDFCHRAKTPPADDSPSPYNIYLQPNPDHMLRVAVALGFRRAKLHHVYSLLRGKDLETGRFSPEQRERQFAILRDAQAYTLDLQHWHDFFTVLKRAGYPSGRLVTSRIAVLYTYALWLIGRRDFGVDNHRLREIMARWYFMVTLTGRYNASPETRLEQDLALLRGASTPDDFIRVLDQQIRAVLTKDYWEVTLPNELESSSAWHPVQSAYYASLCLLDAKVLYSTMKVVQLLDGSYKGKKFAVERHHLFPRSYLSRTGIKEPRLINQIANFALVEWSDNIKISDAPPKEYVPRMESRFSPEELRRMYEWHALPEGWYELDYLTFLAERRKRIAQVIRRGFEQIGAGS